MTPSAYADHTWVSPKVIAGPSHIEGRGLFAREPIREGEIIAVLGGRIVSDDEIRSLEPPYSSAALAENVNVIIDSESTIRFGNHSCDPNAWMDDAVTETARRAIAAGEEITIDYALHTAMSDWSMMCNCGSQRCRGMVRGDDWRQSDLQERYGQHWSPFILERIERARSAH